MLHGVVTRVLLVDARTISRVGLRVLLNNEPDLEVVGEAADVRDTSAGVAQHSPDVVIIEAQSDSFGARETIRRIAGPGFPEGRPKVLGLINDINDSADPLLQAGAQGLLLSSSTPEEIIAAVRVVAAGYSVLIPSVSHGVVDPFPQQEDHLPCDGPQDDVALHLLTRRERDVFRLIARGYSNAEISETLFLSESTVKSHVQRMLEKLALRNRVHAVIYAYEKGMVRAGANALTGAVT